MAYTPQIYYPQSAYNPYQQAFQPTPQTQQASPQANNGLIWVSGEVGAKSYLVAPNATVMLMDSECSKFYIKSTDGAGMPTIRTYEYKECSQNAPQVTNSNSNNLNEQFVTRDEYKAICGKYEELQARIDDLTKPKTRKKEVEADE